jgi:arsenite methyltransferase
VTSSPAATSKPTTPNYGIDAPSVMRNFFLFGGLCFLLAVFLPSQVHLGPVTLASRGLLWPAGFLLAEGFLFLLYVKVGKFRHRDMMLNLVSWRGDEQVLDVGCGRGLLLVGAAKRLTTGHATGIDVWSNEDMGGNSPEATDHNLRLEAVADRCTLLSIPAQEMPFPDGSFDVVVSNLCLHNIYAAEPRRVALEQIVRVLNPGGTALISDYKLTGEYAEIFASLGLSVQRRYGSFVTTFPPLRVVIATKPL